MILVDTCVWIDHFRSIEPILVRFLEEGNVVVHPAVIGELSLGNFRHRQITLETLRCLREVMVARDAEVMRFIGRHRLFGRGIGYIDAQLLAAVRLTAGTTLWTRDKRLADVAKELSLAADLG